MTPDDIKAPQGGAGGSFPLTWVGQSLLGTYWARVSGGPGPSAGALARQAQGALNGGASTSPLALGSGQHSPHSQQNEPQLTQLTARNRNQKPAPT